MSGCRFIECARLHNDHTNTPTITAVLETVKVSFDDRKRVLQVEIKASLPAVSGGALGRFESESSCRLRGRFGSTAPVVTKQHVTNSPA